MTLCVCALDLDDRICKGVEIVTRDVRRGTKLDRALERQFNCVMRIEFEQVDRLACGVP